MDAIFPLELFSSTAVLVTEMDGSIRSCNRFAAELLGIELPLPTGARCWELVGLRCPGGERFCQPECPVRGTARRGRLRPRHSVVLPRRGARPLALELLTFASQAGTDGRAVLHVILPGSEPGRVSCEPAAASSRNPLELLTRREHEVLRLLASGIGTDEVAAALCISPTTVRNHIQRILHKLDVHGRVHAILAFLRNTGEGRGPGD